MSEKLQRRRLTWWSDVWEDITEGVDKFVEKVEKAAEEVYTAIETVKDVLEGKEIIKEKSTEHFWSFNYNTGSRKAESVIYLDAGWELFFFSFFCSFFFFWCVRARAS